MKKILCSLLFLLLLCASALVAETPITPATSPPKKTSVISTRYFDLIYPEASADTAALLSGHADGCADDICSLLNTRMKGRIPVYINPDIQILNAYFTPDPYNRIMIYDTVAVDGSLGGFTNSILMVFYHELTHAISLNIRTPFWQTASEIFGDALSPNLLLTMPLSFTEGVTVSFESRSGTEGRLNDPLTQQYIVQEKIEGKFLGWNEAAGALDVYPGGKSSYLYGGAFSAWLQRTYGMEKYAELWKRGGGYNPFLGNIQGRFAQVYYISLDDAWAEFRESVQIPANLKINDARLSGTSAGIFSNLASCSEGIVWNDSNTQSVCMRSRDGKIIKLFDSNDGINRLSFSPDGTLLLVSDIDVSGTRVQQKVRLFSMEKMSFLQESWPNLRDASFAGDSQAICGIETNGQRFSLVVIPRGNDKKRKVLMTGGPGEEFASLYNPVFAGNGTLACIGANGLKRKIELVNMETNESGTLLLPESIECIRYLQSTGTASGLVLSFAWVHGDSMYRYALYSPATGNLVLQDNDYSGGVFFPVPNFDTSGLVYKASLSGHDELKTLDGLHGTQNENVPFTFSPHESPSEGIALSFPYPEQTPASSTYTPVSWLGNGYYIPFITFLPADKDLSYPVPGLIYASEDPSERYSLMVEPFVSIKPFFVDFDAQFGIRARYISVKTDISDHLAFPILGFTSYRDTSVSVTLSRNLYARTTWKYLSLSLSGTAKWFAPDVRKAGNPYQAPYDASSLSVEPVIEWTAIKQKSIPVYPLFAVTESGYMAVASGYCGYMLPDRDITPVIQSKVVAELPFIPLRLSGSAAWADGLEFGPADIHATSGCVRQFSAGFNRFLPDFPEYLGSAYEELSAAKAFGFDSELGLLTLQIQKGIPRLPLYANRFRISGGYRGALFYPDNVRPTYIDSVYGRASIDASLVLGILSNVVISGTFEESYSLRSGLFYPSFSWKTSLSL